MADTEQEFALGYVDKRRNKKGQDLSATGKMITDNTTSVLNTGGSVGALRTRLAAQDATYFTATRLNQMTKNDMVYALRVRDELGTASNGSI